MPSDGELDKLIEEIKEVKLLLMVLLVKEGVDAKAVGKVLGMTATRVRQMIPVKSLKTKGGL